MFSKQYPELSNFIGAWFADWDYESLSHKETVHNYINSSSYNEAIKVSRDIIKLLNQASLPFQEISKEANIYFENEKECILWLREIQSYFEEILYRRTAP